MTSRGSKLAAILLASLLFSLLVSGCASSRGLDYHLKLIVRPYRFSFVSWEYTALRHEARQLTANRRLDTGDEVATVLDYFSVTDRVKALESKIAASGDRPNGVDSLQAELDRLRERKLALQDVVERIIERQVRDALAEQGIFNPLDKYMRLKVTFPPMNFKLEKPPLLLVVSPRDRIESLREVTLQPNLDLAQIEDIEARTDSLGVSSLVVELGGLGGTYPTLVTNEASLRFTLNAVAEEWLHQYLAFRPLGFLYLLDVTGLSRNYEITTINETVAGIVSKEIGTIVYDRYYRQREDVSDREEASDFNREMREIRRAVDAYLARGQVEQAEEFMEQKRHYLASKGHYIRKLNQAYFAFHGAYADRPTSISPIGQELKELRAQSAFLKDFLDTAAGISSRDSLRRLLAR